MAPFKIGFWDKNLHRIIKLLDEHKISYHVEENHIFIPRIDSSLKLVSENIVGLAEEVFYFESE
ncbi:hypothetical protein OAK75_11495 [Bacteriovoracales bacterium]|nr:hypothetical protein [Bacteriovoracales bacterium]